MISVLNHLQRLSGSDLYPTIRPKGMMNKVYILLTCCLLISGISWGQPGSEVVEINGKSYFKHIVTQGQTLYGISKQYGVRVDQLQEVNESLSDGLSIDEVILIPMASPPAKEEGKMESADGKHLLHTVKQGETLYGISKQYRTDISSILALNPSVELGLSIGDVLKIPKNDLDEPATELPSPGPTESWTRHTVRLGETLYAISKKYDVTEDAIRQLNGGLKEGLRADEVILIPIKKEEVFDFKPIEDFELILRDTVYIKERYSILVMLPFQLDKEMTNDTDRKTKRLREISMSLYRGMLIALDSLKQRGARLDIKVMDVSNTDQAKAIASSEDVKNAHLIIGPLQRSSMQVIAKEARIRGIHMVCPVPQSNKILLASPNISKIYPSADSEMKQMAKHVFDNHNGENVLLINSKNVKDARKVQVFKKEFQAYLDGAAYASTIQFQEIEASSKFAGEFERSLSLNRRNIIVVPAGNQSKSMIANLQTKIQLLEEEYTIQIYAPNEWLDYDFLDVSFKEEMQLSVPSVFFIDEADERVKQFRKGFYQKYETDASEYAFLGYDMMLFYGFGLIQFGIDFPNNFGFIESGSMLGFNFDFRKTGIESGYENEYIQMLQQMDLQIVNASANQ